ncbi:bacillithiol biosynthesis cysteine-adding enzyme BshC [Flavihumibacter rivuli]|uniref:bacillithiol biosynthesis cysteine-adding enzyme BshC n=1 Tax=Flavihumibacter rivuli TaxID=2838156 RepID=UPI001EFA6BED|nr:bacillithiol biosynthesis cysteine-adding enzyme BshC [Flavihumibacter rivuli]ULQ57836.1 bacillithiol biosynthesis cysteine-adding enzyme BshC [Flavihumibacter rivuli]
MAQETAAANTSTMTGDAKDLETHCSCLTYGQTNCFNTIVTDYVEASPGLQAFYEHPVNLEGVASAIHSREQFLTDRATLVRVLEEQYTQVVADPKVAANIRALLLPNTFTVVTAHQPNIFTGYLYFIYKVLHAIKLAAHFNSIFPDKQFVPLYYMGSEDADLDELGKVFLSGDKLVWETNQTGAVGRMATKGLEKLIHRIEGELSVQPFGKELVTLLKESYLESPDIQTATFKLLHKLFARFGLVVLIADHPALKAQMKQVFREDLFNHTPSNVVAGTIDKLAAGYKVQANPREINLFYLEDNIRNRIEKTETGFVVVDTPIRFSEEEMINELEQHPERFSPNVILRGLFQETILPNIAFVGGGGELAYWLELKDLFLHYGVPYPLQVLRNSFLVVEQKWVEKITKLGFDLKDFFRNEQSLLDEMVKRDSAAQVHLTNEIRDTRAFYDHLRKVAGTIDATLNAHVGAMESKMVKQLEGLEKKLLRAEKRKFTDQSRQILTIRQALFPNGNLQERVENFMPYYAKYGNAFIDAVYQHSFSLEQEFQVMVIG